MTAGQVEQSEPKRPSSGVVAGTEPVLSARGVTKTYRAGTWPRRRSLAVLRGLDLDLYPGEIVGLVGENGSGKSTAMQILVGSLAADEGSVQRPSSLGFCPQEPILYERLTCDEHFELFSHAYGMTANETDTARGEIYETLGFARWAAVRVEELSGGTRAKLNLGLALLSDPDVLLLDEPYAGFDWDTYLRFWDLTEERRDRGRALLIISHFITDEHRFDRIYDLLEGRAVPR